MKSAWLLPLTLLGFTQQLIQATGYEMDNDLVLLEASEIPKEYFVRFSFDIKDGMIVAIRNFNGAFLHLTPDAKLRAGEPGVIPTNSSGYFRITRPFDMGDLMDSVVYIRSLQSEKVLCDDTTSNLCVNSDTPYFSGIFRIRRVKYPQSLAFGNWYTVISRNGRFLTSHNNGSVTFDGRSMPFIGLALRTGRSTQQSQYFQFISVVPVNEV